MRIWVLLGQRRGDNNQLLALAEALGRPFETRTLHYRRRWLWWLRLFPRRALLVDRATRATLSPPWPDLTIGIGRRSVAVARWIKARSGGRSRIVRLGNPRADAALFDLVLTTSQYPVPPAANVVLLPAAMRRDPLSDPTAAEQALLAALPRPHLLLSLGGTTRYWRFPVDGVAQAADTLAARAAAQGGTLIVAASPRTPAAALAAITERLADRPAWRQLTDASVRFAVLQSDADAHFVTADSVSMISEAMLTGKPVGLIPVDLDEEGERELGVDTPSGSVRDLRRFWADLAGRGAVGTVDAPASAPIADPVAIAVAAVERLLGGDVG